MKDNEFETTIYVIILMAISLLVGIILGNCMPSGKKELEVYKECIRDFGVIEV